MAAELTYKKVLLNESGTQYNIVEVYPDAREQIIDENQDVYQAWIALGNSPTVVPYVAPPAPTPEQLQALLDAAKASKLGMIDMKTNQLIGAGFTYDSKTFSLSATAQMNWIAMQARIASLTFPMYVSTITEVLYQLVDSAACAVFLTAAFEAVASRKEGGVELRADVMEIYNDTDKTVPQRTTEINAFVDPR